MIATAVKFKPRLPVIEICTMLLLLWFAVKFILSGFVAPAIIFTIAILITVWYVNYTWKAIEVVGYLKFKNLFWGNSYIMIEDVKGFRLKEYRTKQLMKDWQLTIVNQADHVFFTITEVDMKTGSFNTLVAELEKMGIPNIERKELKGLF